MNILYICEYAPIYPGNFIESVLALHNENVKNEGEDIIILPQKAKNREWVQKIKNYDVEVYYKEASFFKEWKLIHKLCNEKNINIIYHHFWQLRECLIAKLIKVYNHKIRIAVHHHNEYHISNSKIREKIKHILLEGDVCIGCGTAVAHELNQAKYKNAICINNCIDFVRLDTWKNVDFGQGTKFLIFSSCGYEIKGIDIAIKGLSIARKIYSDIKLIIAVASCMEEIRSKVILECGGVLPDWIKLVEGISDVATYYHAVDAYLNASRSEGFCYATIEAVYSDCEIIQSNTPGNRLDVPNTFIFENENVEVLAKCVCAMIEQDENKKEQLRQERKKYIMQKYSIDIWVKEELRVLSGLWDRE